MTAKQYEKTVPKPLRDIIDTRPAYGQRRLLWIELCCGHSTFHRRGRKLPGKKRCIVCWRDGYKQQR